VIFIVNSYVVRKYDLDDHAIRCKNWDETIR
jgi:hypothetical protein